MDTNAGILGRSIRHGRTLAAALAAGLLTPPAAAGAAGENIELGGAVRLNYAWRDYDEQNKDRLGDFELELIRINARGTVGDVMLNAEWRQYNNFQAIHHAWVGYRFNEGLHVELGITQVPFGILPFASHSFWFGGTYYMGLEDDYDTGVKVVQEAGDWTFHYGFFKNPEYADDSRTERYSFDLVTGGEQQNAETNQFNFCAARLLRHDEDSNTELGFSLQGGQIYNETTTRDGDRWAVAAHMNGNYGPWNLHLQGIRYEYNPRNPDGMSRDFIQNVTGCSVSAGGVFTYFDWIAGRNMWFSGGDGIGLDGASAGRWRSRLNINIGYYF